MPNLSKIFRSREVRILLPSTTYRRYSDKKKTDTKKDAVEDDKNRVSCQWDADACAMRTSKDCVEDVCSVGKVKQPCVIIVGAGVAGLSAARRLAQCGITNFIVLEASDRPGGRIRSCWLGDTVVELGAQHISGACIANRMYTIAAQEQLIRYPLARVGEPKGPFLTSDGRTVSRHLAAKAQDAFHAMVARAADLFHRPDPGADPSLGGYLNRQIDKELEELPEIERYDLSRALHGLANLLRTTLGEDLCRISSHGFGGLHRLPGGDARVDLGLAGVLSPLLKDLPNCSVLYCKPVQSIRWGTTGGDAPRALVVAEDGQEFPADYVIVTVSLGVLKNNAPCLFCPALPASKTEAINSLGFGHVDRIFAQYERPFWAEGGSGMRLAWSSEELSERDSWVKGLASLAGVAGSSRVLAAAVGGPEAKMLEYCDDSEVAAALTALLRRFTGDPSVPPPSGLVRSCWSTDPHFYGAYTYMALDSGPGHIKDLSDPLPGTCEGPDVPPILLFAGEATSPRHYSTLHGARESGIREADRIICLTRKLKGPPRSDPSCPPCAK